MNPTIAGEILDLWARNGTPEAKAERRAVEALKRDIQMARDSIQDAVLRYWKAKLCTRSRAKANSEDISRPLEGYDSQVDTQNVYGYEMITETEYDYLIELWELRAQSVQKAGLYKDRVVEMLELTARAIWDAYGESAAAYDEKVPQMYRETGRIAQGNLLRNLDSKSIRGGCVKYQKIYDALRTGDIRIDLDQSGWCVKSSGHWIAGQCPLWLVAEVPRLHLRVWVTYEFDTLSVTTTNFALPIDSRTRHESHTRRTFQDQREMAEYLEDLLSRKEAAVRSCSFPRPSLPPPAEKS